MFNNEEVSCECQLDNDTVISTFITWLTRSPLPQAAALSRQQLLFYPRRNPLNPPLPNCGSEISN